MQPLRRRSRYLAEYGILTVLILLYKIVHPPFSSFSPLVEKAGMRG